MPVTCEYPPICALVPVDRLVMEGAPNGLI